MNVGVGRNRVYHSYLSAYKQLSDDKKVYYEQAAKQDQERYSEELQAVKAAIVQLNDSDEIG